LVILCASYKSVAQDRSIAREWNEVLLEAIRNDFARPTVHARNLFHSSVAMYDAWAMFDETAETYLLGRNKDAFASDFDQGEINQLRAVMDLEKTISYAMYTFIQHRYADSPDFVETKFLIDEMMEDRGYDINIVSTDYKNLDPASLGNFIASEIIRYGLQDGANEAGAYENVFYQPGNESLNLTAPGISENIDPNRWQPLLFNTFIDQSGNPLEGSTPAFLSPEWGFTSSFALEDSDKDILERDDEVYFVYLDPGAPPLLDTEQADFYKWGFSLVAEWSSHLDPSDMTSIDISPASIGNIDQFPEDFEAYQQFYKSEGGDWGQGRALNPRTMEAYAPQIVSRGDYARVLAEFWADGPDSETPPGHWFSILNYVMDHPEFTRMYNGQNELAVLEYDVKAYFMLGGAVHDAAIAAWSVKGYYDYIRPISALRYMAAKGQSTDPNLPRYHPHGILLIPGTIELIEASDPDFPEPEMIGQIKIRAWKGPDYINNPASDVAGVDWVLAANWWPYQRPSFVTPPFAGYVSGHSTFSRAAADVLAYLTGDEYFPGGMGIFVAEKDAFLVFEDGPSEDIILQWATYRDASDQCSLSRIWGGIHPPADDIPGRKMGEIVATKTISLANNYFIGDVEFEETETENKTLLFPNPVLQGDKIRLEIDGQFDRLYMVNTLGQVVFSERYVYPYVQLGTSNLSAGVYFVVLDGGGEKVTRRLLVR